MESSFSALNVNAHSFVPNVHANEFVPSFSKPQQATTPAASVSDKVEEAVEGMMIILLVR